ncbi:MAG: carbon monoxide dehydrogenase [Eggerthellaceae bacterium]|nr:carbon monoxide dehydrogenase [Eggerthellaceae bacterium]
MNLYDTQISDYLQILQPAQPLPEETSVRPKATKSDIIMRADMAYELGEGTKYAVSGLCITESEELVPRDQAFLIGLNLTEITEGCDFARIAFVRVVTNSLGEEDQMYKNIRAIEYARYHLRLAGYMLRVSSVNSRESVRVSKEAISQGLGFEHVANQYFAQYHKNKIVKAVHLYFVTDPAFDYKALKVLCEKNEVITRTIDHSLKGLSMDCSTCADKPICDKIEGIKDLHFLK